MDPEDTASAIEIYTADQPKRCETAPPGASCGWCFVLLSQSSWVAGSDTFTPALKLTVILVSEAEFGSTQ